MYYVQSKKLVIKYSFDTFYVKFVNFGVENLNFVYSSQISGNIL